MPAQKKTRYEDCLLLPLLLLCGSITACAPSLVNPIEPNSALVMGRVNINNKYTGGRLLLPIGIIDHPIEVEVWARDESQVFKAKTERQGIFFIPNLPPNTYVLRRLTVERHTGNRQETQHIDVNRPIFTPVPGKIAYIGTLLVDVSEKGVMTASEVREDDRAKAYFVEKYGASLWGSREFVAPGSRPAVRATAESRPETVQAKPIMRPGMKAEKPEWKVGFEWQYAWKRPGGSGTFTREIVREAIFEGVLCYVIRNGQEENFHPKDTLGLLATMSGGKLTFKRDVPFQPVSWPLEVGKMWRNTFTLERLEQKSSQTFDTRFVVPRIEEVAVPAGTFEAFKIENYNFDTGRLEAEYWYSPKVRRFVKERLYQERGILERDLISFKAD